MALAAGFARRGEEVYPRSSVWDVEFLRIESGVSLCGERVQNTSSPAMLRIVVDLVKILHDRVPRCITHVLQDDHWWLVLVDPLQHSSERSSRFSIGINLLLLVVEVRVVDT